MALKSVHVDKTEKSNPMCRSLSQVTNLGRKDTRACINPDRLVHDCPNCCVTCCTVVRAVHHSSATK